MSKKAKTFGPSNDTDLPADELYLAKLIQNARSRGLHSMKGFRYDSLTVDYVEGTTTACCALGAVDLEEDTHTYNQPEPYSRCAIVDGNDSASIWAGADVADRGESVGYAFYQACSEPHE